MSDLPSWLAQFPFLTPAAMLGGIYWMLASDRLVTGASHRRELAEKDARIAERDRVIERQAQVIEMRDKQVERLSIVAEAIVKMQNAIEDALENQRESEDGKR